MRPARLRLHLGPSSSLLLFLSFFSLCLRERVVGFPLDISRRTLLLSTAVPSFPSTSTMVSTTSSDNNTEIPIPETTNKSSPPRNIRWGIVGLGDVTEKKSGPPFYKADGCELVAVMRRTPGKAAEWAQRVPGQCVGYDNLNAFLDHPGLDAVYVATRPGSHFEICKQAASKGKTIYVEKPVGRCAAETKAIADLSQISGQPVYTAYISRAYKRTQALRQLLKDGAIGDRVTEVQYTLLGTGGARGMDSKDLPWRLVASEAGGGLIMDVGCHVIDRIDYLCGPLDQVKGEARNFNSPQQNVEDFVELKATIDECDWAAIPAKDARIHCTWDFSSRTNEKRDELVIRGPKGSLRCVGMSPFLPVYIEDTDGNVVNERSFEPPEHTAQELIQAVTDELRGVGSADFVSRTDNALRTARVIDTVLLNYYGDRDMGYWEKENEWPGRPRSDG